MKCKNADLPDGGLTFPELLVVVAILGLITCVALPLLAANQSRSEQAVCFNNLRQTGRAIHLWGNDHADRTPWFTPVLEGGTRNTGNALRNNAYFQMGGMSNELNTPAILICPSDLTRKMASNFSADTSGGFFSPGFRDASLSYLIGLHSIFDAPESILSGDRNIHWDSVNNSCSLGVLATALLYPNASAFWTSAIHSERGNLLFTDGRVDQVSNKGLQKALSDSRQGANGSDHFMPPN